MRWVEFPGGVHVHGDHGAATLRGPHALALLERLAPRLDGALTLGELTSGLPEAQRDLVTGLVGRLADLRFVVDDTGAQAHGLSAEELETYAAEIAFAGHPGRFARVRNSALRVTGTGVLVPALVECLRSVGWREVVTSGGNVLVQVSTSREELLAGALACPADVVLAQVLIRDDEAWLTSAGPPGETDAATGWGRLSLREGTRGDWLRGAVPRVLASQVALGVFSAVTGLTEARRAFTRVDLRSLESTIHRFAGLRRDSAEVSGATHASRTPAGGGDRDAGDGSPELPGAAGLGGHSASSDAGARDRFFALCRDLVDPRMGVIAVLDEGAHPQGPLSVVRALAGDREVVGWGADHDTARLRCLLAVFAADSGDGFVGAGLTWEDAVSAAHRQRLEAEAALVEVALVEAEGEVPVPQDGPLWRQVVASGEVPVVRKIPGSAVLRFEVPDRPPIVSLGLHDGLERVLLRAQTGLEPPVRWASEGHPIGGTAVSLPVDGPAFVARVTS
ncbi:hypothetical protein AB0G15_06240 [Streptosporangium sp. NPDC023825]|uniref:hypothetical protein n=1 Tax=Streptosporangium sp. NPDC023825 TaxID=3154909 RepID=UPI00342D9879